MKAIRFFTGALIILILVISGCKKDDADYVPQGLDMTALKTMYNKAVIDAATAEPYEIYRSLVAIIHYGDSMAGQGNLIWSTDSTGRIRVLVTSWMKQSSLQYWPEGKTFTTSSNQAFMSWVTTAPEMLDFLKKHNFSSSASLHLRIAQVLGMPPDSENDYFVEFWVYPEDLFRPTPDPEINDHEANLYFPGGVSQNYKTWFLNEMSNKYDTTTTNAFPWTRLGYTYDWADPLHEVGLSEFIIDTSSVVSVQKIYSSYEYYQLGLLRK